MKRYDVGEVMDLTDMVEHPKGDYVLYADMIREMIPRPDADAARKAVDELLLSYNRLTFTKADGANPYKQEADYQQARAALLKMMGVE